MAQPNLNRIRKQGVARAPILGNGSDRLSGRLEFLSTTRIRAEWSHWEVRDTPFHIGDQRGISDDAAPNANSRFIATGSLASDGEFPLNSH